MAGNQMDQKIYNKTITIQEIGMKQSAGGNRYSLKDHDGKTFSFFTTKKDGTDTSVFAQFKSMELKNGDTVMIGFVEDEFTNKEGKNVISKKIINFRETNEAPVGTAPQAQSPRTSQNNASQGYSGDAFGRRLAIHGMVNGMLAAGATVDTIIGDLPALIRLEDKIDKALVGEFEPIDDFPPEDLPDF